jgi:nitroreductase
MPGTRSGTSDLWEAIATQRAIRRWQPRPVPDELLWRVIEAATKAPSGSNLQPWRFVVVRDAEKRAALARLLRERFTQQPQQLERLRHAAQSAERSQRLMLRGALGLFEGLDAAPVLIVPCLYELTSPTTNANSLLAGSSIYLAVQNLLLVARALGLATVFTTLQAGIEAGLRQVLALPDDATPVALVPLGFPDADFGPTRRRPVQEVTFWDGWGGLQERDETDAAP